PLLDPIGALGVDYRDQANDAAVAALPVPGKQREGAALAGDLIDVAADVLDAQNAVLEQDAVHRLPVGKIRLPVASARPRLVLLGEVRVQRAVALRADGGGERMVGGFRIVADALDLFLDEPLARRRHEAGRAAEIVLAVLVDLVPAGVDDDDVARTHRRAGGLLEIVVGDRLPLLLRN